MFAALYFIWKKEEENVRDALPLLVGANVQYLITLEQIGKVLISHLLPHHGIEPLNAIIEVAHPDHVTANNNNNNNRRERLFR